MTRIGVIGAGGWGKNHVRVLNELGVLAAVGDIDKERMELYSGKYRVAGYTSVESMLDKEKLDGVTICTPAWTHFQVAKRTLEQGIHSFVEKPMTTSVKEAEDLIQAAQKSKRTLTVGFIERFNPAIAKLKRIIMEGNLGEPILLEFHRENRRGESVTDVGVVKDASVHDIDTARWLFGGEPNSVFARVGSVTSKLEDFAAILLGFKGDRTAFIISNWVTPNRVRTLTAVFTKGVVTVDFVTQQMQVHEENGTSIPKFTYQEPLMLELKEFVSAIEGKRQPLVTGRDGLSTIRIAESVLASSKTGSPIFLAS